MNTYSKDKMYESYSSEVERMQKCIDELQQENKQLKEQLLVAQTNEETFRLEMEDITKILGLDENTLFDDVKTYARSLKENKILRENAEHNDKVVDKVNWENMLLKKENEKLKDNWNDLKKYAKEVISTDNELYGTDLLDKMLEIEKGNGSNE